MSESGRDTEPQLDALENIVELENGIDELDKDREEAVATYMASLSERNSK